MNYKKLFGYGVLIWIVIVGAVSVSNDIFLGGLRGGSLFIDPISIGVAAAIIAYFCGSSLKITSRVTILRYSIAWAIINLLLDTFLREIIASGTVLQIWEFWYLGDLVTFIIIVIIPLFAVKKELMPAQNQS